MPFSFEETELPGVILVTSRVFADERGFVLETYKQSEFRAAGISVDFVQENHSRSTRGVIRGLHYQRSPHAQGKLVRCLVGEIFDVAVDIRPESPTFGVWAGVRLSAENRKMLYTPAGLAHGFATLSEVADVHYKTTAEYAPDSEAGIRWDDPTLAIQWPLTDPVLSEKDRHLPGLHDRVT